MADHGTGGGPPPGAPQSPGALSPFQMLTQPISSSPLAVGNGATGGKNAPPPPNFQNLASQGQQSSQTVTNQQTQANRPDQTTPFASGQWYKGPDGQWHQNVDFSGALGGINRTLQGQFAQNLNNPLGNGDQARQQAINAGYQQATSRLDPQWSQRADQLNTQLANQGLDPNSAAYRNAQRQFGQSRNDAYTSAMNSAISNGNQAQALTFGQNLEARNAPLQELGALQGFLTMPGFSQAGRADPLQALQAAMAQGSYGLDAAKLQGEQYGDIFSGFGDLLGAGMKLGGKP